MDSRDTFITDPPAGLLDRWQAIIDMLADVGQVAAAYVVAQDGDMVQVLLSSSGSAQRVPAGARRPLGSGSFCDVVIRTDTPSHVADARADSRYATAMKIAGGLASHLGYPLHWPDGSVFGALCVLDTGANEFAGVFRRQVELAVRAAEAELAAQDENARLRAEIAAHRQTEEELRVSRQRHEEAQQIAQIGHWHHDLRSGQLIWSDQMFRLFEIDPGQFPASYEALLAIVHPDDRLLLAEKFAQSVKEHCEYRLQFRVLTTDGRCKWMKAWATTTYAADGEPLYSVGTTQDITARKEAELALRDSEALHRRAQALANIGHWRLDLVTGELSWSEQQFAIFEMDPTRFAASYEAFLNLVHPDDRAALDQAYRDSVSSGTEYSFEHRLVMPDGRTKWVLERARTDYADDGTPLASIGTTQDITERKDAGRERDMLAQVVRYSRELINIAEIDGRMVFLNETGGSLLGIDRDDVARHLVTDVIPPHLAPLVQQELLPALNEAGEWFGELQYRNLATGELRDFQASCFRIDDRESGRPAYIANVSIDITERKAAEKKQQALERQLLHVQKLESLGVMAGGVAHDFNNILQAILGNLEIVEVASGDRASNDALVRARQGALRAADITRQLLTFAGRDSELRQHADLGQVVEECANLMRAVVNKRILLEVAPPRMALPIEVAPGQIQQVLMNLVTNAADAIGDTAGTITIRLGSTDAINTGKAGFQPAGGVPAGELVYVDVSDTGSGMDEETIERLFDPFFTRKAHGHGLGMASVLGIVRSHHGAIDVDSIPARGTRIRILLPRANTAGGKATAATVRPGPSSSAHVLLVDDDESIRKVGEALLQRRGFQATTAGSGESAIALLDTDRIPYECVVLDLTMPGLDGADVFRFLRARHPQLPVLLASGFDRSEALRRIGPSAHTGFIQKPWHSDDLFEALAVLLQRDV